MNANPSMRLLGAILGAIFLVTPAVAADKPEREAFDDAIDRGLEYLARYQQPDGSWARSGSGRDPAITSLCAMAFLSAGHVPGEGPYGAAVEKGIKYVVDHQLRNGLFAISPEGWNREMYTHGICTLMLAESVGMSPERGEAKRLQEKLKRAVAVILGAQVRTGEHRGGWRYGARSIDSDISVTGWQLMALRAAKNVGCDIPAEHIEQAAGYIKRCHDAVSGGYKYQHFGFMPTIPCTGTSVLALSLIDKDYHQSNEAYRAGSFLLKNSLSPRSPHFYYGIYYTSQAMFQIGEKPGDTNYWTIYRKTMHDLLLRQIPPRAAGYWTGFVGDDRSEGPNYCTAMAILALTVEYRLLPIYQRGEEPAEREVRP